MDEQNSCRPSLMRSDSNPGSTSALAIAFHDLKRRYLLGQTELRDIKSSHFKMSGELTQSISTTQILERKIEQLESSLKSKMVAFHNLEAAYRQTREHEETLIKHSSQTEQMLVDVLQDLNRRREENNQLRKLLASSIEDKQLLETQLQEMVNVPEVTVAKYSTSLIQSNPQNINHDKTLEKQVQDLNSENQTLRTSIHWLNKELRVAHGKEKVKRVRHDSDSLEEGKKISNTENSGSSNNLLTHIEKLHTIIQFLRATLQSNGEIINELILQKSSKMDKPCSKCSLNALEKFPVHDQRKMSIPSRNNVVHRSRSSSAVNSSVTDDRHGQPLTTCFSESNLHGPSAYVTASELKNYYKYNNNTFSGESSVQCVGLPPSLLENVQRQKTETYLTSKTFIPRIPSLYMQGKGYEEKFDR